MNKKIRVGIIGTGTISQAGHMPAVLSSDKAELVGILTRDKSRGVKFLENFEARGTSIHTNLSDFVGDDSIELAIVCSPDGLHYQQIKECLQTGKHVLAEKPMTLTVAESEELTEIASSNGLRLAIGFHMRSHEGHRLLHEKIHKDKSIGNLRHIRAIWAFPQLDDSNWRAKDTLTRWWSLSAVGSHCIDQARWFANDVDDWMHLDTVTTNSVWGGPHDETAIVSGELASGVTVEATSSVLFGPCTRIELFGDKGTAVCIETMGRHGGGEITINGEVMEYDLANPFTSQLENVADSILLGAVLNSGGDVGLRSVKDLTMALDKT
jgi:predicted dehydrogenase